ncbi:MAG TPA: hypothetical protein VL357_12440 [Rariglobus sp.]|jgi:predicted HNH restriction endonuclease|nr:hypothetical protein [Rariglobus sp.]
MPKPIYVFERLVTQAEADKGHITIITTHHEWFKKFFGPIHRENETKGKPELALKDFFIEKEKASVKLKLVFRSSTKERPRNELRLYFNEGAGQFKPAANEIIIATFYDDRVVLGVRPSDVKNAEKLNDRIDEAEIPVDDPNDPSNKAYTKPSSKMTLKEREAWKRDAQLARKCLQNSSYTCEAGFSEPSFISKKTKKRYLEVHHLVPLRYQDDLATFNLNDSANLFALSPHAHRKIHYGRQEDVRALVETLLERRPALLTKAKLPKDTILQMYKCV